MDWHWALINFIGFTGGLAVLFTFGELLSKEKSPQIFIQSGLFLLASILQFHTYLVGSGGYLIFPHLYMAHLPFTALFGSVLARYFSILWTEEKSLERFRIWELLPSLLVVVLLFSFYLSPGEEKIKILQSFPTHGVPTLAKIAITITVLPIFAATYYVFTQLFQYLRWETLKSSAHLRLVMSVVTVGALAGVIGLITLFFHKRHGLDLVSVMIGFLLIFIYLLRLRNPELIGEVKRIVIEEKKYQTSQLKSVNLDTLGLKMKELMQVEKIYRDDELNLQELSTRLSVSPHQLSEYLNQHLRKNFFQYVNHHRVKEAKILCKSSPEQTILSIAFEVGFPSKSTFYDAFKRETGMSPTEYRKSIHPK